MRRFEFKEGSSSKFWQIDLQGESFTVTFGRIGAAGQTQLKTWPSADKARAEHDKLVKEKTGKGYLEVGAPTPSAPAPEAKAAPAAAARTAPATPSAKARAKAEPAPEPARRAEGPVVWTDEALEQLVRGRKAGKTAAPRPLGRDAFFKLLAEGTWGGAPKQLKAGIKKAPKDCAALMAKALDYDSRRKPLAVEVEAASLALHYYREKDHVRFWGAEEGLLFALEAASASAQFAREMKGSATWIQRAPRAAFLSTLCDGLRELAAAADEKTYRAGVAFVEKLRKGASLYERAAWDYVFPTEQAWAEADLAEELAQPQVTGARDHLLVAVRKPALVSKLLEKAIRELDPDDMDLYLPLEAYLAWVDEHGAAAVPMLRRALEVQSGEISELSDVAQALALVETPEAAETLAEHLKDKAVRKLAFAYFSRAPHASIPGLARAISQRKKGADQASALLASLSRSHPEVVAACLPTLDDAAKALIAKFARKPSAGEASEKDVPPVLADPPWSKPGALAPVPSIKGLKTLTRPDVIFWDKGEKERFAQMLHNPPRDGVVQGVLEEEGLAEETDDGLVVKIKSEAKADAALEKAVKDLDNCWNSLEPADVPVLLARLGTEAIAPLAASEDAFPGLGRAGSVALAPRMAEALTRRAERPLAERWALRFPEIAAVGFVPLAFGNKGKPQQGAVVGLQLLSKQGQAAVVKKVAKEYGGEVEKAVEALVGRDPMLDLPGKPTGKLPKFFDPKAFSRPRLKKGDKDLPVAAVERLGEMLALCGAESYPGIDQVKDLLDPESLEQFAWELFEAWLFAGAPSKEQWPLWALGHFGRDETARRLTPLVRAWPGESAHARAVLGLDVLGLIGTDVALMHLHGIAQKLKFKGLQEKARQKIGQIAESRGLSVDELADRLVPDLDLEPDGSRALDFGARKFKVGFDEALRPVVFDAEGSRIGDLPKPGKSDDAKLAAAAAETWKALKKDAKAIASGQILRLELAMCSRRRWAAEGFRTFLVEHPLVFHLTRRLVWGVYDDKGKVKTTFRIAEDRSYADSADGAFTLPASATVGIVHALELDAKASSAWSQLLADYALTQPFPQLGRPTFAVDPKEKGKTSLDRVKGRKVKTGKVVGLQNRGWRKGSPQDAGQIYEMVKPMGELGEAELSFDPGINAGGMDFVEPEQTLGELKLPVKADALDPILFSELVRDAMLVAEG